MRHVLAFLLVSAAAAWAQVPPLWVNDGTTKIKPQPSKIIWTDKQLQSTVTTGTAPLSVSSTTLVSNLNVEKLNSQSGSYYLDVSNMAAGTLATARGGLGMNASASTGVPVFATGVATFHDWLDQSVKVAATPTFSTVTADSFLSAGTMTIQPGSSSDVDVVLVGTGSKLHAQTLSPLVLQTKVILQTSHNSSNVPAAGFGAVSRVALASSSTNDQTAHDLETTWASPTHASRKARVRHLVYDTAAREAMRHEASGTAPMIGFLGTAASAQLVSPDVGTALTTFGLTSGTPTFAAANLTGTGTGVLTWLATPSSANLAAAVTDETGSGALVFATSPTMTDAVINQAANGDTAIKSVRNTDTSPTGNFLDFQSAAASSIYSVDRNGKQVTNYTAQSGTERLLQLGVTDSATVFSLDNGTANNSQFNPTFNSVAEQTVDGVPISFFSTKGVDSTTNPAILFLGRHNTGGGNTDLSANVPIVEVRNRATTGMYFTGGYNLQLLGGSTSPTLAAAASDKVSMAGVDGPGTNNRELQVQPEAGGFWAYGSDTLRRVPNANRDTASRVKATTTTGNTATTIDTVSITSGSTYLIEARIVARRTGGSSGTAEDGASYVRRGTYTTKAGTVTLMGAVQTIGTDAEDQAGWDATLTISGTNVLVQGTGATNNNVSWQAETSVQRVAQ